MKDITVELKNKLTDFFTKKYGVSEGLPQVKIEKTKEGFEGDFSINIFPFLKMAKTKPEQLAAMVGDYFVDNVEEVISYNVVKGF